MFRRFVAFFVGVLLLAALVLAIATGDEGILGTALLVGGMYAVYLIVFFRREKAQRETQKKPPDSPLLRR